MRLPHWANRLATPCLLAGVAAALLLSACIPSVNHDQPGRFVWTWVNGSSGINSFGVWGGPGSVPGADNLPNGWMDIAGNFWVFGGSGYDSTGVIGHLNTFWKFDGTNWTWVGGGPTVNQVGVYSGAGSIPGSRQSGFVWTDGSGNPWLFGGNGYDNVGVIGYLSDLWKFDGTRWILVSGGPALNSPGVYGTRGVAAPGNVPGARWAGATWVDSAGNFWLFGGGGYDSVGTFGYLSDLWKFDGTNWTWMSGSPTVNVSGVYGTQGVAFPANAPGGRNNPTSWIDRSGNLWLFGGGGYDSVGAILALNDLWKFDGTNWTWVKGSTTGNAASVYGTLGVPNPANVPAARGVPATWTDSAGHLWLFGGTNGGTGVYYNDLWVFDGANWTWLAGSTTTGSSGSCGTQGVADFPNVPSATAGAAVAVDPLSGTVWMFGGSGIACNGAAGNLNILWKYSAL